MRKGVSAQRAAHFLMKLMFCMFGERIGLLPSKLFGRLLETAKANPAMLTRKLQNSSGRWPRGRFWRGDDSRFNGGLFADDHAVPLTEPEINILASLNAYDWSTSSRRSSARCSSGISTPARNRSSAPTTPAARTLSR